MTSRKIQGGENHHIIFFPIYLAKLTIIPNSGFVQANRKKYFKLFDCLKTCRQKGQSALPIVMTYLCDDAVREERW